MGEGKRRQEAGMPPQTVRLPALSKEEVQIIHEMMHHRMHELAEKSQSDPNAQKYLEAVRTLHRKLFAH